jgi:predicted ATPase
MIREVSFRNFKALRDVTTTLERFTAIVGPNAAGKSSFLQGLQFLLGLARAPESWLAADTDRLQPFLSRDARGDLELECTGDQGCFRLRLPNQPPGSTSRQDQYTLESKESPGAVEWHPLKNGRVTPRSVLLRLEAATLARPSYTTAEEPTLGPTGEGLHSALAYLAYNQPDSFRDLQSTLTRIVPAVRGVRLARTPVELVELVPAGGREVRYERHNYMTELLLLDTRGAKSVPAQLASEGTLLVLGILTVLYGRDRPELLLLDDVDRGLHPKARLELVAFLRALLETRPDLQLVATTHSPYVLDKVNGEEVRLITLRDDGSAVCGRLRDHPEFERWREEMTPGEFWMMFGEKWLTSGVGG